MDDTEPAIKKTKMTSVDEFIENIKNSQINLVPIMDDMYINPIPFVKCNAGQVKDVKQLSNIIKILNEKLPLKDLSHLKRVSKRSVLLCHINHFKKLNYDCIRDFIQDHVPELKDMFEYIRDVDVPALAPLTKKQNTLCNKKWVTNFHPNKRLEKMLSGSCFAEKELAFHRTYMSMAFELAKMCLNETSELQDLYSTNAAIVVDPSISKVVAIGVDNRQESPVQHATMVAIDNVARTQNGGVWETNDKEYVFELNKKFANVMFGARKYLSKVEGLTDDSVNNSPYLCTGYDLYLVREPCVMCAMGLVHARIKRVFFTFTNDELGALKSRTRLHCIPSLNHRFEVFTGFNS